MNLKERWKRLNGEIGYYKLLESGLFFEIFPELTGDYEKDKKLFLTGNNNEIIKDGE